MATHSVRKVARHGALLAVLALVLTSTPVVGASVDPMVDAQQFVYELNLARWNPGQFATESGSTMPVLPSSPPVAIVPQLFASAMFKANEMADYSYFAHQSPVTGIWPNGLVRQYGYPLPANWPDDNNFLESIQAGSDQPGDVLHAFAESPSHRAHVFGENGFGAFRDIGVGRSSTGNYWAVHLTQRANPILWVTGVVYSDDNGNGRMDRGEGIADATVTDGTAVTSTNAGGGYALPLGSGTRHLTASTRGRDITATFRAGAYSIGADFEVTAGTAVVRAYELCAGLQPTIMGTDGDDVITGTDGPDVIAALDGNDVIDGLGGDDIICGGKGKDRILGGGGSDTLYGGSGRDRLNGGGGRDQVFGGPGADRIKGNSGRDALLGQTGSDRLKGGAGDDSLDGGPRIDTADGGPGIDACVADEARLNCER
jgi:Ca2+-binding RTX toxin-like protein